MRGIFVQAGERLRPRQYPNATRSKENYQNQITRPFYKNHYTSGVGERFSLACRCAGRNERVVFFLDVADCARAATSLAAATPPKPINCRHHMPHPQTWASYRLK